MKQNNNLIKKIIKKKNFLKLYKKNYKILIINRGREFNIFLQSFVASSLSNKKKIGVLILSEKSQNKNVNKILSSLGFDRFINLKDFSVNYFYILFKSVIFFLFSIIKIKIKGLEWFAKKYKLEGIYVGDLIYDAYIRYDLSFLNNKITIKFLIKFYTSLLNFLLLKNLLKIKKIKYLVCEGGGYSNLNGLGAKIASNLKINNYGIYYNRKNNYTLINKNKIKSDSNAKGRIRKFKREDIINFTKNLNKKDLDQFITKRYQGKISTIMTNRYDIISSNKGKIFYTKEKLVKKIFNNKSNKKIILIAAHVFSDCPHLDKKILFKDYYEHLDQTLNFIKNKELDDVFWLVKPHPSTKKYNEDGIVVNMVKKLKLSYVKICPKDISTNNLTEICDNVITCTGTIALEFAVKGKRFINAGTAQYSNLGVTLNQISKEKYFKTLINIKKINNLSINQVLFAKKIFYFFENFSPGSQLSRSTLLDSAKLDSNEQNNQNSIINRKFVNKYLSIDINKDKMIKDICKKI